MWTASDESTAFYLFVIYVSVVKASFENCMVFPYYLQCLKCGSDFSKDSALRQVPKNAVRSGTYTNLAGSVETGTGMYQ